MIHSIEKTERRDIMTLQTIPFANLAGLLFTSLTSVVLPLVLWVLACKKWQEKPNSLVAGSGGFVIFALILEQSVNSIVLNDTAIQETPWLLYLYGGAVAALFEELGRFFMMKVAMRKKLDAPNAVLYGLGHGGIESVMVVGMTYVNNFIIAVMVQSGKMAESLATLEQAEAEQTVRNLEPLWTLTADQFFLPGVERVLALAMQVAFSLLVYRSVKDKKIGFLGLSLLCHFLMTFLSSLAGAYLGGIAAEACNLALTAVICGLAWKLVWQPENGVENPDNL